MTCAYCGKRGQWGVWALGSEELPFCSDNHFRAYKATVRRAEKVLTSKDVQADIE